MRKRTQIVFVLFIAFFSSSFAQQTSLTGQLIDALSSKPIVDAKVELEVHGRIIYTNKDGFYTFGRLQACHEVVKISAPGYARARIPLAITAGPNDIGSKRLIPQKEISSLDIRENLSTQATPKAGYGEVLLRPTRKSPVTPTEEFVGTEADLSFSSGEYLFRGELWHRTDVMRSGWKIAAGIGGDIAKEGIVAGTPRQDIHIAFLGECKINKQHSLSLSVKGAVGQRGLSEASLQEAYDLKGIYYNPNWGYQQGEKRNARIEEYLDPMLLVGHTWTFSTSSQLKSELWGQYNVRNATNLSYFNAPNPFPEYYTNLPSSYNDEATRNLFLQAWKEGNAGQIDWGELYRRNLSNNVTAPGHNASYLVEKRHKEQIDGGGRILFHHTANKATVTLGAEAKYSVTQHYKTMYDLLGGATWKDIEQRPLRENSVNYLEEQNDLNQPNRTIAVGDRFGYNYAFNRFGAALFAQQGWKWAIVEVHYKAQLEYSSFRRMGKMRNGRAEQEQERSYGAGEKHSFVSPGLLAGATVQLNKHINIQTSIQAQMSAPEADRSYLSPSIKDTPLPEVKQTKEIISKVSLHVDYPKFGGYIELFRREVKDFSQRHIYLDDSLRTSVNVAIFNLNQVIQGITLCASYKPHKSLTINLLGYLQENRYTNNGTGVFTSDNQGTLFSDKIHTQGLYLSTSPQLSVRAEICYHSPHGWFISLGTTYFDKNYVNYAPLRFASQMQAELRDRYQKSTPAEAEKYKAAGSQERLPGGIVTDASVGAIFKFPGEKRRLGIHLSATNLLNDKSIITGGYQQNSLNIDEINRYPTRYTYAWGSSFSAHFIFYL